MPKPSSTKPSISSAIKDLSLTKKLKAAAKAVIHQNDLFCGEIEQAFSVEVAKFKFINEHRAKRGERLFCEIFAKSNPALVDKVIADFHSRFEQMIKSAFQSLNDIEQKIAPEEPLIKKLRLHRFKLEKIMRQGEKLVADLKRQCEIKSWETAGIAWTSLNGFTARINRLSKAFTRQEIKWNRLVGIIQLDRVYASHDISLRNGCVIRTGSQVQVAFGLFMRLSANNTKNWLARFCRENVETIDPAHLYPLKAAYADLDFHTAYDELFNNRFLVGCDLPDENKWPSRLKVRHADSIRAQEEFDKLFLKLKPELESIEPSECEPNSVTPMPTEPTKVRVGEKNMELDQAHNISERKSQAYAANPIARFEKDFSMAIIVRPKRDSLHLVIEPELRTLVKRIIDAGGFIPRTLLRKDKSDPYQPEKLLRSKTATAVVKAGLLGTQKNGRTSIFWAKAST